MGLKAELQLLADFFINRQIKNISKKKELGFYKKKSQFIGRTK